MSHATRSISFKVTATGKHIRGNVGTGHIAVTVDDDGNASTYFRLDFDCDENELLSYENAAHNLVSATPGEPFADSFTLVFKDRKEIVKATGELSIDITGVLFNPETIAFAS
jgi:hypothetical protein